MGQSLTCLNFHLIFSIRNRANLLISDMQGRLYNYLGGILREKQGKLLAAGGMRDHVHLLVSTHPPVCISDLLRDVKAASSRWIHETFPPMAGFAWQDGYGAFSVSYSGVEAVRGYITQQAEHHKVLSFQEELLRFLEKHGVEYDPRYIWS
jgi:REP element-mobilizing transposase RayT